MGWQLFLFLVLLVAERLTANRPPRFVIDAQSEIVLRLKEGDDTPVGTLIYKLRAIDPDGDQLHFGVRAQLGSEVIRVESVSANEANIYLNRLLDREERDEYPLVLTLTDHRLGQGNFITQSLLLLVEDVNDNTPVFNSHPPSISIREDASPGTIATLEATDADEGAYGQVVYHLQESDDPKHLFGISTMGKKAILRLVGTLDYEQRTIHQLRVLAVDRAKEGRINTGTAVILVKVEDVEDQPPEFVRITPVARVAENSPIGTSVLQVTAIDGDRGINNKIEYSLVDNEITGIFDINRSSGLVTTKKLLDRELLYQDSSTFILRITAKEIGGFIQPIPSIRTEVTVIITDVNDETPTFRSSNYECHIAENAPVNTPLTFHESSKPEVFDYDQGNNGTFILYLSGDHSHLFEVMPTKVINEATFMIKVKNASLLDYEKIQRINLTLNAKEVSLITPHTSQVPVTVQILDRNDNYPEFISLSYEVSVMENCAVGTTITRIQATDRDSKQFGVAGLRYTNLTGSIAHLVHLHPTSGVITVRTAGGPYWDREQVSRHYLTVEVRDDFGAGNRNSVQIVLNIEDVNDNAPIFSQKFYEARLLEHEMKFEQALRIEARDADYNTNGVVEFTLLGEWSQNFTIHPKNGILLPRHPIDFEHVDIPKQTQTLNVTIRARDLGTPSMFTDTVLNIYVQDINDHAPKFEATFYNKTIPETLPSGTSVLRVHASDNDGSAPNNRIVYRIQSGAEDKFVIGAENGIISVARGAILDPDLVHPKKLHYALNVVAIDQAPGKDQLQAGVTVSLKIRDVNNKTPTFPGGIEVVKIKEDRPIGSIVARVVASDLDSNANLVYRLNNNYCEAKNELGIQVNFSCSTMLQLNSKSGAISVAQPLDREQAETIFVGIIVEDIASENGQQIASSVLNIVVEDVNDNDPKFQKELYKLAVPENTKTGVHIGYIVAEDVDKNKSVSYELVNAPDFLHLDHKLGAIMVSAKIDRETKPNEWYNFSVKAIDYGIPRRLSIAKIMLQIIDENDNSPIFADNPQALHINENAAIGTELGKVQANDIDSGDFGRITYLLDRISSQGKFSIDPDTGVLTVADELDREERTNYLLIIEAWDNYQYGFSNGESRNAFKHINVTILDVNDNGPHLIPQQACTNITEFHEIGQTITMVQGTDLDDPTTSNGQLILDISDGNHLSLFALRQINEWTAEVYARASLRGLHGIYTLLIRAQDLGMPSHLAEEPISICVTDFNDHAPVFVSPSHNTTIRVPENTTLGTVIIQVKAEDDDVAENGIVRFRLKMDPAGHWKFFSLDSVTGNLLLRVPFNRKKQRLFDIRIEAYDLGTPTSLSTDLDLTIYVTAIDEFRPYFLQNNVTLHFTENTKPGIEVHRLPDTVDRDELDTEGPIRPTCYFIVGGNHTEMFSLNPLKHELTVTQPLDRELHRNYTLIVKATEECQLHPTPLVEFDLKDDTFIQVIVHITDVNDNAPKFIHRIFTGGVSTATKFGTTFMEVKAVDLDEGENARVSYKLIGRVQMTLTEGLDNLQRSPFIVDEPTGAIQLNFDPQKGMKGYFDFMVLANDTGGLQDMARVFIYLLREDQRVRFVLRQHPNELRPKIHQFRHVLGNVTGAIVNIDEFRVHANHDGTVDKTRTDLFLHLVDRKDNSIIEVDEVLRLVDQNTEKLDTLFKDFNVLDTQPGVSYALQFAASVNTTFWLSASSVALLLLLLLCLFLCFSQRQSYQRKLKAATATAYGADSEFDGRTMSISGRVPNTNKHSMEGSNPIWLQAYENEWYKNSEEFSANNSEHDSLDENVVACEEPHVTQVKVQNVYQTLPPVPPQRKLETTEL